MDIASIKADSRAVEITHPATGEKLGIRITLLPDTDPKVKKVQREFQNRQFANRKMKLTAEQLESNTFESLVAAVSGWEWYGEDAVFEGEKPEFSDENVRRVLKKAVFIKEQLLDEFNNREAFYEG